MVADVVLIGLGAMGSMAAWRLAARGARVVGLDAHVPPHDRGSSHGESRLIRTAYYEGPWYVPLLRQAIPLWRELERESGAGLLSLTGAAMIGRPGGELVAGSLASAREHGLAHQLLSADEAAARLPAHVLGAGEVALLEPLAGLLRPERCIEAALRRAAALGADLRTAAPVRSVTRSDGLWVCDGDGGSVVARDLVLTAGCAAGLIVPELAPLLRVERQVVGWFPVDDPSAFAPDRFPVFCHELPGGGLFYGVPSLDGRTVKVAAHHGGPEVDPAAPVAPVAAAELDPACEFVSSRLRGVRPDPERSVACRYTNTPDGHFLVDRLGGSGGPLVVSACSGHGFKFAGVIGDAVADLVLTGSTEPDIGGFSLRRLTGG